MTKASRWNVSFLSFMVRSGAALEAHAELRQGGLSVTNGLPRQQIQENNFRAFSSIAGLSRHRSSMFIATTDSPQNIALGHWSAQDRLLPT